VHFILGVVLIVLWDEGSPELTQRWGVLVWDDEIESAHEMFNVEDEEHHGTGNSFEGREGRPSSPCLY